MLLLIVIALSLLAAAAFKRYVKRDVGDALLASIIFIPALLFWVGKLPVTELSAFGLSGKFAHEARRAIGSLVEPVGSFATTSLAETELDFEHAAFFEACNEYYILRPSRVPARGPEVADEFSFYIANSTLAIKSSLACGSLLGVIVLDEGNRYIGSYDASFFAEALAMWAVPNLTDSSPMDVSALANHILESTTFGAALQYPDERIKPGEGFVAAVNERLPLSQALPIFDETNAPYLVITDARGIFKGLLTYDRVAETLLSALVGPEAETNKAKPGESK